MAWPFPGNPSFRNVAGRPSPGIAFATASAPRSCRVKLRGTTIVLMTTDRADRDGLCADARYRKHARTVIMLHVGLPVGSMREYDQPLSVFEVAASISLGLANAALAGRVDGVLVDCGFLIECDARVSIVTSQEPDGLEILRRSCALMLAMAVKQLHPNTQLRAGSALGDGFFYEFAFQRSLTLAALPVIEARMRELAATNHSIRRQEQTPTERLS